MRSAIILLAALAGLTPANAEQAAAPPSLPAWLAGGWLSQSENGKWSEEWWTTARGGMMFGAGRSGTGDKLEWWEQTRIDITDGKLRFCARPKNEEGACFLATKVDATSVLFENPNHDFPTRISYRKAGDELVAEISGPGGANAESWHFRRMN